jgi:fatty acid-binding protein DegV
MQDILALLEDMRARTRLTIVLDTLENLRRGGRADGFIAIVDRMTRAIVPTRRILSPKPSI